MHRKNKIISLLILRGILIDDEYEELCFKNIRTSERKSMRFIMNEKTRVFSKCILLLKNTYYNNHNILTL